MSTSTRAFALLALSILAFGCADDGGAGLDDVEDTAAVAAGDKTDAAATRPQGHYVAASVRAGDLNDLVLNADHTFTRNTFVYCAATAYPLDCGHAEGTYKFTKSTTSSTRYIRFLDADGDLMDRYAYTVHADSSLGLRRDDDTRWFSLAPHQFDSH